MNANLSTAELAVEGFELSPQQRRLLQGKNDVACDHPVAQVTLRLPTDTNIEQLRKSFEILCSHHEILRTSFQRLSTMALPIQVISPSLNIVWQDKTKAENFTIEFDQQHDGGWEVTLTLSAAQMDSESLMQLVNTWVAVYREIRVDDQVLQYADYAVWREELIITDTEAQAFWEARLHDLHAPITLPFYRKLLADATPNLLRKQCHLQVPLPLQQQWHMFAKELDLPLSILPLAVWLVFLHQHNEDDQVSIWVEWQQRNPELAGGLGVFCDALPLTINTSNAIGFKEFCQGLNRECASLIDRRDCFPSAHTKATTESQSSFAGFRFIDAPCDDWLAKNKWEITSLSCDTLSTSIFLEYRQQGECLSLILDYETTKFNDAAIALIKDQILCLLENACRRSTSKLNELSALSETTQHWLEREISQSPTISPMQQDLYCHIANLPNLALCFDQQCKLTPNALAVKGVSGSLSYHELDMRAFKLAQQLLSKGAQRGTHIGHFLNRDIDAIVAMVAILKIGAVYVPVDPVYPTQRIKYIFADSKTQIVITHSELVSQLPSDWQTPSQLVLTDRLDAIPSVDVNVELNHTDLAYLIYTSGSTGEPKGVMITHGNALHSLAARLAYYPVPVRHFLLLSSFSFDSSIAGLFWTLAQGGCLYLATEAQQRDPLALAILINQESITHLLALPSLYQLILTTLDAESCSLATAIVAGEACRPALVDLHFRQLPNAQLYNEYGPTEASVWSTVAACHPQSPTVGIGFPIPNSRIYLLDTNLYPVAPGMKGEVYIGGPGISPGYFNRPELTAEKFIEIKGERLYRTGDFAGIDEYGALSFLGRADAQVKLRGYRIELGEIEAALQRLTTAEQVVVLVATDESNGDMLRAFIESENSWDSQNLRRRLEVSLPEYMIPSDIQVLPRFPQTANGKVDKNALIALSVNRRRAAYRAPQSPTEVALADIWQSLLSVEAIGLDDDFFALGGHSLLVVKLIYRIKTHFEADIAVSQVFQFPTLTQLASQIEHTGATSCLVLLKQGSTSHPALFCLHQSFGEVHHYDAMVKALPMEQTVFGIGLPQRYANENSTLVQLAEEYCREIEKQQPEGPYLLCGWSIGGVLALEIAHQLEARGNKIALLGLFDSTFDADDDPLTFDLLIEWLYEELTPEGRKKLEVLPEPAFIELQTKTLGKSKLEQLRTLYQWVEQQHLSLVSSVDLIEHTLRAMSNARRWLSSYHLPIIDAVLQCWWAQETTEHHKPRIQAWKTSGYKLVHHYLPGNHDTLLDQAEFLISFATAIREIHTEFDPERLHISTDITEVSIETN